MKTGHNYYVYIVRCADDLYYTGVTNDLERRLWEHNTGYNGKCFTFKRRPVILMYQERFQNIGNAIAWEKQVKGWSRKKKEALFKGDWEEIKKLAKSKRTSSSSFDKLRMTETTISK
jgi:putative endonuclease